MALVFLLSVATVVCWHLTSSFCSVMKLNQQSIPDFETLFVQIQEFITSCNGEQARYALESCKYFLT